MFLVDQVFYNLVRSFLNCRQSYYQKINYILYTMQGYIYRERNELSSVRRIV